MPVSSISNKFQHNINAVSLPASLLEQLSKERLSTFGLFYNDFVFDKLFNNSNLPIAKEGVKRLADQWKIQLRNEPIKIKETDQIIEDFFLDANVQILNSFYDQGVDFKTFKDALFSSGFETAFLKMLEEFEFRDSHESKKNVESFLYFWIRFEKKKISEQFESTFQLYRNILETFKSLEFPKFNELFNMIKNFYVFMIEQLMKDLNTFEYIPHTKLPPQRGIPKQKENWLISNLYEYNEKTSFFDDLQNNFIANNPQILEDDDEPFFTKWSRAFGMGKFYLNIKEDDHGEHLHIYLIDHNQGIKRHIADLGTAYSHIIILLIVLANKDKDVFMILEEPEANLHPKFQSLLADTFLDFINRNKKHNQSLLIETHSEYLIRKLQYLIARGKFNPEDVMIYYIDDPDPKNRHKDAPQVREITIDKFGRMSQDFGPGFFDEADNIAIQLFNLNQNLQSQN